MNNAFDITGSTLMKVCIEHFSIRLNAHKFESCDEGIPI